MVGIQRLLIANRGEIALRVARACRERGIEVVAIAGPGDAGAAHVEIADEVVGVPSYLDAAAIVRAAVDAVADAVHPGYGFLSEQADFADRVLAAGLIWVGPPPSAMRALGDKIAARSIAEVAGVPVVPGSNDATKEAAEAIGYPLLVKAAGGGGGRGMRAVEGREDLASAVEEARAEARSAFGDDRVFLERRIDGAHHVEVQILLDAHGAGVHLGERDCSIQRRHQKIVEESPSPVVDEDLRARLGEAALAVAAGAGYAGAGTVEFLLTPDDAFAFLEMNARLQVEHPVTEAVTGIDLVQAQLRIADGEALDIAQGDVRLDGHAVEARVYAEDPAAGFLPAAGRVAMLHLPTSPNVRIDTALRTGDAVGSGYDPLLAKVIASGSDRADALARLREVLADTTIVGLPTNLGFLLEVLGDPDVLAGAVDTGWVERTWTPTPRPLPPGVHAGVDPAGPWARFSAHPAPAGVVVAGSHAFHEGWDHLLADDDLDPVPLAPPGGLLVAPIPATVTHVHVAVGDGVTTGQPVVTLEAMKVQIRVDAPAPGTVRAVHVAEGDMVRAHQTLVDVEPA